ncbi:MAG: hypothetical protein M3Y24_03255 [Acidobacteriota bacterium]|nr:hypothetical protein [Acidobacteriota bacterium]
MAGLFAILRAIRLAVSRELGTFESIKFNNFFLFVALMVYGALMSGLEPKNAGPLLMLLGLLVLFPISSDPLAKIPRSRLASWPIARRNKIVLRIVSLGLSPIIWITIFLMWLKSGLTLALSFLALAVVVQCLVVLGNRLAIRGSRYNVMHYVPSFPGVLGPLIRSSIHEMLAILDTYIAVLLSAGGIAYRLMSARPDATAFPILSALVALALSTHAQSLFGFEFASGITRYRLLPLRGWQILLAKDIAFLSVLAVLVAPLDIWAGLASGLGALALGHRSTVFTRLDQRRWRFASGRVAIGIAQTAACLGLALGEQSSGPAVFALTASAWAGSLVWYGRVWERRDD